MTTHLFLIATPGHVIVARANGASAVWAPLWSQHQQPQNYPEGAPRIQVVETLIRGTLAEVLQAPHTGWSFDSRHGAGFVAIAASAVHAPESRFDALDLLRFFVGANSLGGANTSRAGTSFQDHFKPIGLLCVSKGYHGRFPSAILREDIEPKFLPKLPDISDPLAATVTWLRECAGFEGVRAVPRYSRLGPPGEPQGVKKKTLIERAPVLNCIREHFASHRVVVLTGDAGVGKTQIAQAYARQRLAEGHIVVYLGVKGRTVFRRISELGDHDQDARHVWEEALKNRDALVVLDDPESIEDCVTASWRAKVLLTTRVYQESTTADAPAIVQVDPLDSATAATHLNKVFTVLERQHLTSDTARAVCSAVGCLPITIRLAAAAISAGTSVASLLERVRLVPSPIEMLLSLQWDTLSASRKSLLCMAARIADPEGVPLRRLAMFTGLSRSAIESQAEELERKGLCIILDGARFDLHPAVRSFLMEQPEVTDKEPLWFSALWSAVGAYVDTARIVDLILDLGVTAPQEDLDAAAALIPKDVPENLRVSVDRLKGERVRIIEYIQAEAANIIRLPRERRGAFIAQQLHNAVVAASSDRNSRPHVAKSMIGTARSRARQEGDLLLWLSRRSRRIAESFLRDCASGEGAVNAVVAFSDSVLFPTDSRNVIRADLRGSWQRPPDKDTDAVWALSASTDGQILANGNDDKEVNIWSPLTSNMRPTASMNLPHETWVNAVAVSPDGSWVVAGEDDGSLAVWFLSASDAHLEQKLVRAHAGWVLSLAIAPDGSHFVSGGQDGSIKLWARRNGSTTFVHEIGQRAGWIRGLAITPGGMVVAASSDTTATVWLPGWRDVQGKADSSRLLATLEGPHAWIRAVAITPEGRHAVTGSDDGILRIWSLEGPDQYKEVTSLAGHLGLVRAVAVTPDGRHLVSAGTDGNIKVWDLTRALKPRDARIGQDPKVRGVTALARTSTGQAVAWFEDGSFTYHGLRRSVQQWHGPRRFGCVEATAISDDGGSLIVACADDEIWRWNLRTKKYRRVGRQRGVKTVSLTADEKSVICASTDGRVVMWSLEAGCEAGTELPWTKPRPADAEVIPVLARTDVAAFYCDRSLWFTGNAGSRSVWLGVDPVDAIAIDPPPPRWTG